MYEPTPGYYRDLYEQAKEESDDPDTFPNMNDWLESEAERQWESTAWKRV